MKNKKKVFGMFNLNNVYLVVIIIIISRLVNPAYSQSNKSNLGTHSIPEIIQEINNDSILNYITQLQSYQSRFLLNPNRLAIANWLKNKLESFGYENARIDSFSCEIHHPGGLDTILTQYNVIASYQGLNTGKLIYGAHYDSFSTDSNPFLIAPGADDNASGTAAVLETARVIQESGYETANTIEFILFAAEEFMLNSNSGSEYRASQITENEEEVLLMINNDMIGYNDGNNTVCFSNYPSSATATNLSIYSCQNYTNLNYQLWPSSWEPFADVEPFCDLGIPSVYYEESFFNPFYHTSNDLIENMDIDYATEVCKISCGSLLSFETFVNTNDYQTLSNNTFVYPNPCHQKIQIQLPDNEKVKLIELINIHGRQVNMEPKNNLNVQNLKPGFYILNIETDQGFYRSKFQKI